MFLGGRFPTNVTSARPRLPRGLACTISCVRLERASSICFGVSCGSIPCATPRHVSLGCVSCPTTSTAFSGALIDVTLSSSATCFRSRTLTVIVLAALFARNVGSSTSLHVAWFRPNFVIKFLCRHDAGTLVRSYRSFEWKTTLKHSSS